MFMGLFGVAQTFCETHKIYDNYPTLNLMLICETELANAHCIWSMSETDLPFACNEENSHNSITLFDDTHFRLLLKQVSEFSIFS